MLCLLCQMLRVACFPLAQPLVEKGTTGYANADIPHNSITAIALPTAGIALIDSTFVQLTVITIPTLSFANLSTAHTA